MTDYISRQAAIDWLTNDWNGMVNTVFFGIKHIPTADVVEVVRCKDCKHRYVVGNGLTHYWVCNFLDAENKDYGYCSYGEREEQWADSLTATRQ